MVFLRCKSGLQGTHLTFQLCVPLRLLLPVVS